MPTATAAATTTMKTALTTNSEAATTAPRPTPTPIAAGRLRPPRGLRGCWSVWATEVSWTGGMN